MKTYHVRFTVSVEYEAKLKGKNKAAIEKLIEQIADNIWCNDIPEDSVVDAEFDEIAGFPDDIEIIEAEDE